MDEGIVVTQGDNKVVLTRKGIVDLFHQLYYHSPAQTWQNTFWMGCPILKNPLDMWIYQEMLYELRPDLIVEAGTYRGGGTYFLAHMCDIIGSGEIITIDVLEHDNRPQHSRITYLTGSSTSDAIVDSVRARVEGKQTVLIILDSDHSKAHVLAEMERYHAFVTPGSYLIVEDSNVNGHPVAPDFGDGPMEAIEVFMQENDAFEIDAAREKFMFTQNPKGFLKKK